MKRMRQRAARILTLIIALCMMLIMTFPVMAEEENNLVATEDPRDSIMLMTLGYEDDNGNYIAYKAGTCFLINNEYVLTNKHVVTFQTYYKEDGTIERDELAEFRRYEAVPDDLQPTDSHVKLYLYVNRDMKVSATMHDSVNSDDMDFAAVKLAENIYDRKPVALGDSDVVQTKDTVYAMGFPADSISTKDYNTKDDVSTVEGAVSKMTVTGNVDIIEHTAPLNLGNSGGPLLDKEDNVIGLNTFLKGKKDYSIQINYIKNGLDTFGIPYVSGNNTSGAEDGNKEDAQETSGETATEPEEEEKPDNTAIIAELQSALSDAKAVDTANYTEESVKALDDTIGTAEAVLANDAAEAMEIQSATDDLNDAINGLEEKSGPNMMLIIIIAAVAVVVIIIIIVVIAKSGKKKKAASAPAPDKSGEDIQYWGPNQVNNTAGGTSPQNTPMQQNVVPEGAGETTLLDAGAGETTLLSSGGSAYLIRKKNGEKIAVNLQNFKLGKERKKVNYCISDNTSVSRVHCEIVKKGADYYVIDQGATNFTFVNGVQLSPRQETLLSDQSVLKLSDEEFEFHLS